MNRDIAGEYSITIKDMVKVFQIIFYKSLGIYLQQKGSLIISQSQKLCITVTGCFILITISKGKNTGSHLAHLATYLAATFNGLSHTVLLECLTGICNA